MHNEITRLLEHLQLSAQTSPDVADWVRFLEKISQEFDSAELERTSLERQLVENEAECESRLQDLQTSYEQRQNAILDAFPDLLFLFDETGRYLEVVAQNNDSLVMPLQDLIGRNLSDSLPQELAELIMAVIYRAVETGLPQTIEYELDVISGPGSFEGRVIPAGYRVNGQQTVLYLARDITEKKRHERRQKLLNSVMRSATEGIVIVRSDKKILYANSAIERITGYSEEELIQSGEGFLRHELDQEMCDSLCRLASSGDHLRRELVIHHKLGSSTQILLSMDTIRDDKGEIEYFVGILTDISEQKEAHEKIEHMANHDVLTGLPNRMMFEKHVCQVVSQAIRKQASGALFFLDLDRFKSINDTLGHGFGDLLLIEVARRLKTLCRPQDMVARFGGDEFVLIIERVDSHQQAAAIGERILRLFDEKIVQQNYELKVAASIGIALFPNHAESTEQLIQQADVAMYEAKKAGRNQYKFFTQQYLESAITGLTMEQELLDALERNEFLLEFQPQYRLRDETLCGFEALIRWQHPLHGRVAPGEFISIAESCGLIDPMGLWVFQQVCERVVAWSARQYPFGRIAFNLSQRQLMDGNLASTLIGVLRDSGAIEYAEKIEFEITESLIIKQMDIAMNNIERLKATGMKLAIDDFGTGHSSLVNLKRYPLDRLKIDRGFVMDIGKDQNDEAIIKASVTLAQGFGLQVVAEGVENELQKDFLIEVGCDEVQGYLYHPSLPIDQAEQLLKEMLKKEAKPED